MRLLVGCNWFSRCFRTGTCGTYGAQKHHQNSVRRRGSDVTSKQQIYQIAFFLLSILFSELKVHFKRENGLHIYDEPTYNSTQTLKRTYFWCIFQEHGREDVPVARKMM